MFEPPGSFGRGLPDPILVTFFLAIRGKETQHFEGKHSTGSANPDFLCLSEAPNWGNND